MSTLASRQRNRRGSATVEVAICAPVLIIVTFGFIEVTNLIFLRQTLMIAGYDALRVAVKQGATEEEAVASAQKVLDQRSVNAYFVFPARGFERLGRGEPVNVRVRADTSQNAMFHIMENWGNAGAGNQFYEVELEGLKE